jgi:putative flippase GtrA
MPEESVLLVSMPVLQKLTPLTQNQGMRQFVKFGIVGAISTVINFVVLNLLLKAGLALVAALTIAFLVSVCNGFYWNRRWTFAHARGASAGEQGVKFLLVNIVGWLLNTTIVVLAVAHFTAGPHGGALGDPAAYRKIVIDMLTGKKQHYNLVIVNLSQVAATCVVVFWNFFANRFWTFKHSS